MKKNTSGGKGSKQKSVNWFKEQEKKQSTLATPPQSDENRFQNKQGSDYQPLDEAPIVKVQMKSKKEAEHFEAAYAFALKTSDPSSSEVMTVHLNMKDELIFNMEQDQTYLELWERGELMRLVAFPRNWRQAPLELSEEDEDSFGSLETDEDRFDYLYETGMAIYEREDD